MKIDGLSLKLVVDDLNKLLIGGRIEKIFQPGKFSLIIWVRNNGSSFPLLLSADPQHPCLLIAQHNLPENPANPPAFCMLLRKHLEDGRIGRLVQKSLDRIVEIQIDVKDKRNIIETKCITIELMGKHSNIIFCINQNIIDAIKHVGINQNRFRQILPGIAYSPPPHQDRINILEASPQYFVKILQQQQVPLAKAIINTGIGIGPLTAKEILWRAGLTENILPQCLDQSAIQSLIQTLENIVKSIKSAAIKPTVLLNEKEAVQGITAFPLKHIDIPNRTISFTSMNDAADFSLNQRGTHHDEKDSLKKLIGQEINKIDRKLQVIKKELADASTAEEYREQADLIMAFAHIISRGMSEISLPDLYNSKNTAEIVIQLDPQHTAIENAQRYYAKYNKFKRAQGILAGQLSASQQEKQYYESVELALDQAETIQEIKEIRQELFPAKTKVKNMSPKNESSAALPRQFYTDDGFKITVGKNNRQNDMVTFKIARPDDYWFHTKDIPGSHVILHCEGREPSEKALNSAAILASYYSKARQSANVPVDYTRRRFVKKPSGAKPGYVIYTNQNTIYITPDEKLAMSLKPKS